MPTYAYKVRDDMSNEAAAARLRHPTCLRAYACDYYPHVEAFPTYLAELSVTR